MRRFNHGKGLWSATEKNGGDDDSGECESVFISTIFHINNQQTRLEANTKSSEVKLVLILEEEEDTKNKTHDEDKEKQPWVGVIKGNQLHANGLDPSYTAPTIVNGEIEVHIEHQDISFKLKFWENALIMYVIGSELTMTAMKKFMQTTWNFVALPDIYFNEEGYFIINLKSKTNKEDVLRRGPYTIFKKPMFFQDWNPHFNMKVDAIRVLPIWVNFHQLPLKYWGEKSIGKVSSLIGKPMMTDECTEKKLRVSYARVLIEVDITSKLKETITIHKVIKSYKLWNMNGDQCSVKYVTRLGTTVRLDRRRNNGHQRQKHILRREKIMLWNKGKTMW